VEERRLGAGWRPGTPLPHPALGEATRVLQHTYRAQFPGFGMIQYRDGRDGPPRSLRERRLPGSVVVAVTHSVQFPGWAPLRG